MDATVTDELAGCLRSWRERVGPADAGLADGGQRRVRGLRRARALEPLGAIGLQRFEAI